MDFICSSSHHIFYIFERAIFSPHCLSRICGHNTKLHCSLPINRCCVYANALLERIARAGTKILEERNKKL